MTAADIFCGAGGLSLGLKAAGLDVRYAADWEAVAADTHESAFPGCRTECRDIREVDGRHILEAAGEVHLLAGGPSCQGLSQRGARDPNDPRNMMLREFLRLVGEVRPPCFLMENVAGLAHKHNLHLLRDLFDRFADLGYRCGADVLLAADYGVPQLRHRMFLIGRLGGEVRFPAPTHGPGNYLTSWEAVEDMPLECRPGEVPYAGEAAGAYARSLRRADGVVGDHVCTKLTPINQARVDAVPPGGNWKDLPPHLLPERFFRYRMTDQSGTYARLRPDQPAFTITCRAGNVTCGTFIHPAANRSLSVREAARIQSFPDWFSPKGSLADKYRQVGNAVPPRLAAAVARAAVAPADGDVPPRITGEVLADERKWGRLVLTPRFQPLFGSGTRWPAGWGPEDRSKLDNNYSLKPEFRPPCTNSTCRTSSTTSKGSSSPGPAAGSTSTPACPSSPNSTGSGSSNSRT